MWGALPERRHATIKVTMTSSGTCLILYPNKLHSSKMVCKLACILFSLILAAASATHRAPDTTKVRVGYYAESLCPDCLAFSNGPMNKAVKEVNDIFMPVLI